MGQDKPSLYVGELTLLDRVLSALAGAAQVVVVGPVRPVAPEVLGPRDVVWAQEDPPGAGPVAALAAGLEHVTAPLVVVLAADLPFLTPGTVRVLLDAAPAVLVDDEGREQYLCSAWSTPALREADLTVDRMGRLAAQLSYTRVGLPVVPGGLPPWTDCDTPDDLQAAQDLEAARSRA
jgi:molybdopterin-guanine dinucleotide biosynthesis protein A